MIELLEQRDGESAKQYVTRVLVYNIVYIHLEPGEKIVEQDLCAQFHNSRTPIREALLELSRNRLIDIFPKRGTYVSYIDPGLVEEIRHLRSVLESELAVMACDVLTATEIDRLRENIAVWQYYIGKRQEKKIFELDKRFHAMLYEMCSRNYWYELVASAAPHFDRTTILSFRCRNTEKILSDHAQLVDAIEEKDKERAYTIARKHMQRYSENLGAMKDAYPKYFKK